MTSPTNRTDEVREQAKRAVKGFGGSNGQLLQDNEVLISCIASAITSAVEQERTRILKLLEEADPLMANSHGWEDDTPEQLASDVHDYLVNIVRQTPTQEGV